MEARDVLDELRAQAKSFRPQGNRLGLPAARIRQVGKELNRSAREREGADVIRLALELVDSGVWEARQIAYELLASHAPAFAALRGPTVTRLGRGIDRWEAVDGFGIYVAGPAWQKGRIRDGDVARWAASDDRWWRRAALVATVPLNQKSRGGKGDAKRTLAVCDLLISDRDDMVVKAMSWALRELAKREPDAVRAYVAKQGDRLAARARREVRNKLETGVKNPRGRS